MPDILSTRLSRRALLRVGGCAGVSMAGCAVTGGIVATQTDFLDRVRGVTHMPRLDNPDAWRYQDGTLVLALNVIPELATPGSAVRLEDEVVPEPLLIVHDADDAYHVFVNKCPHAKRKIDLVKGKLECTSISKSTFDMEGGVLSGPTKTDLTSYALERRGDELVVTLA